MSRKDGGGLEEGEGLDCRCGGLEHRCGGLLGIGLDDYEGEDVRVDVVD